MGATHVLGPGSSSYNASLASYFALQTSDLEPLCFVLPQTPEQVSAIIGWVTTQTSGKQREVKVAIRSGGHMCATGASNAHGGVTVDLRALNSIQVHPDRSTVSVGAGATWDAVYAKLDPLGISVAGGRIANVGVGGLTLGGGISFFGPRHGWTCDTVSSFEVVLANGSIVQANEQTNADLFHGLRGGSNNLGVVTRIDLKTFRQGDVWFANIVHPLSTIDDQARIVAKMVATDNYDRDASFIIGLGYTQAHGMQVINNQLAYAKPGEDPSYYRDLLQLPAIFKTVSTVSMTTLAQQGAAYLPPGKARYMFATATFVASEAMFRAAFDAWDKSLDDKLRAVRGLVWSLSFDPVPRSMYQPGAAANVLGLGDRHGKTLVVCLISPVWEDEADDKRVRAAARKLVEAIEAAAKKLKVYDPFLYLNYAADWQEPVSSYGKANVGKLQELRARVDPRGVFTRLVPGGFKIPGQGDC